MFLEKEKSRDIQRMDREKAETAEVVDALPVPFNRQRVCRYEPIEKGIDSVRVLIVDNLLRDESDISDVARAEWGKDAAMNLRRERQIAEMALQNITSNIQRLVKDPETRVAHVSALVAAAEEFRPQAIVLSGTLRDFDFYKPEILADFSDFIPVTTVPVLAICAGHQLTGLRFGALF